MWEKYGGEGLLSLHPWLTYDEAKTVDDEIEIVVQINGKIRDKLLVPADIDKAGLEELALANDKIKAAADGKTIVKVIAIPGRLVNVVVK